MRVMIVDDSILMRTILKEFFLHHGAEVVAEAANGRAAIEMNEERRPDVVTMDIDMPMMNGIDATAEIMKRRAVPVVVVSGEIDDEVSFAAFRAGAADVVEKPELDRFYDSDFTAALFARFQAVVTSPRRPGSSDSAPVGDGGVRSGGISAVVLGASTGGPVAVKSVLSSLAADFPVGIAVVQHIEARFADGYARWLDDACALRVKIAEDGDALEAGTVYIAPGDRHLLMSESALVLDDGPKIGSHRPAVDRLFETAAESFGSRLAAVLLTGMGRDGAAGCVAVKQRGGYTIVQDEKTSFIFGMPKAAAEMGGASIVAGLEEIPRILTETCNRAR